MARGFGQIMLGVSLLLMADAVRTGCYGAPQQQESSSQQVASDAKQSLNEGTNAESVDGSKNSATYRPENRLGLNFLEEFARDQKAIWTSPRNLHLVDADWIVPLGMATGGLLATDTEYSKHLSNSPTRLSRSNNFSNLGIAAMAGAGAGFYFLGQKTHDDHKSETGLLAGEAAIDSFAMTYGLKYVFSRQRPLQNNYEGNFWSGSDSFPSEHAAAAWSIASVIAHEYPGPLTTVLAYGAAAAISASRITAKQHFPSDVLIGSAIGWYVGRQVYRAHHNPELGGGEWETYAESRDQGPGRAKGSIGSPFVELDSWIYPAMERLIALGYIRTAFLGQRPWTRIECAHLVEEAGERIRGAEGVPADVSGLYWALADEFRSDLEAASGSGELSGRVESLYARATAISGEALNDSRHFGQTIINDFGRPYQEGFNSVDGFSAYATEGRFTIYVRGEYQHAPSAPAYSDAVRDLISNIDNNPIQPATPIATQNQFRLLDTYISANVADWNLSFGKQSLWWGPDYGGDLIFSNNAEPIYMFRVSRTTSFTLPWIFHWLGPMKTDAFYGKLSGNEFPPRPLIHGEKISFKPTPELEFGFTRLAQMGGAGRALTPKAIFNSYTSRTESIYYKSNENPGKRTGGFDFNFQIPHARHMLTLYMNSLSSDDESPFVNPPRAAVNPGIYLSRFPHINRLTLRVEGVNTNTPLDADAGFFIYYDFFYHDLSTNKKNIFGSWIGRNGTGIQAWSTYWFGPRSNIQFGYRHAKVSKAFIPKGETVNDASASLNWWPRSDLNISTFVQYEKWLAPFLAPGPQTNWTSSVDISFWPHGLSLPFRSSAHNQYQGTAQVTKDTMP